MGGTDRRAWQGTPPPEALRWAARAVDERAAVRSVRRLGAGIAQATHALTVDDAFGRRHRLVLQRWVRPNWEIEDPGFDPAKEAAVLDALAGGSVQVPRVVAVDPDGSVSGAPALLTERLPGAPPTHALVRRPDVLDRLGATLADIHGLGAERTTAELRAIVPAYYPFGDLATAAIPTASIDPGRWRAALELAGEAVPDGRPSVLLHRDFHAWNTLWLDGELTGVVDWSSASWGPPAADLAHLRADLATDVSVEAAVRSRAAYAAAGGDLTDARHHQVRTIFDYLSDADPAWLEPPALERLDAFLGVVLDEPDV